MRRAFDQTLVLLLVVAACTAVAASARAQGTGGHLPDPADSRTLTRLLDRYVSPTVPQWLEIENAHEAYLARFSELREEEIARFLEFTRTSMNGVPDARTAREYLRRLDHVRRKIAEEDSRLVNEIAVILDEEQLAGLMRVRRARERTRLTSGLSAPGNAAPVLDLWTVLEPYERELDADRMRSIDPELIPYEERLVPVLRAWRAAQESMFLVLIEELQARGLGELTAGDTSPEEMEQAIEVFRQALEEGQEESRSAAERVRKLNERTIKSIENLLGEDLGRRIRMAYVDRVSKRRIMRDPGRLERIFTRLLEREDLDESTREAIRAARQGYRGADDRQVQYMLVLCDELDVLEGPLGDYRADFDSESPIGQQVKTKRDAIDAATHARGQLSERTREQLRQMIEPLGSAELVAIIESGGDPAKNGDAEQEHTDALTARDPERGGPTEFIPGRISRRDLEEIRQRLEPEPWQQAILSTIHDDYLDTWRLEIEPIARESASAQASVYALESATLRRTADPEKLLTAYQLARQASDRVGEIDREFFDDLNASLAKEQQGALLRARLARDLDRYLRGTDPIFSPSEVAFKPANVIVTIDEVKLSSEEIGRVDEFLRTRSEEFLKVARAARDVRFESEQRLHDLNIRMSEAMVDGTKTSTDHGIAYRKLSDEMAAIHGDLVTEWKRTHEAFVEDLAKVIDEEHAREFRRAWKRASNPYVYRDPNAATMPIEQALDLADLTGDQLGAIAEILAEYDTEWERLSNEMADVHAQIKGFGALTPPEDYSKWRELGERYVALTFERDEASMRALRRLARYLEPEQCDRIRALRRLED